MVPPMHTEAASITAKDTPRRDRSVVFIEASPLCCEPLAPLRAQLRDQPVDELADEIRRAADALLELRGRLRRANLVRGLAVAQRLRDAIAHGDGHVAMEHE